MAQTTHAIHRSLSKSVERLNAPPPNVVVNQAQTAPLGGAIVVKVLKFEDIPGAPTHRRSVNEESSTLLPIWDKRHEENVCEDAARKLPQRKVRRRETFTYARKNDPRTEKTRPTFEPLRLSETQTEQKTKTPEKSPKMAVHFHLHHRVPELHREHVFKKCR